MAISSFANGKYCEQTKQCQNEKRDPEAIKRQYQNEVLYALRNQSCRVEDED